MKASPKTGLSLLRTVGEIFAATAMLLVAAAQAQREKLEITAPADGTVVTLGQIITVGWLS